LHSPAIDGYTINGPAGRNPYGRLYSASRLGKPCIIAILDTGDPALNEKFLATAKRLSELRHPHLVTVVDSGLQADGFYVAWDSPDGTDLRTHISEKTFFPFEKRLEVIARLCEALDAAHAAGFVHRNIEPRHIFIDDLGHARLSEFTFMETGRLLSTYCSPELVHGTTAIDGKSDQFSIACVLHEWLVGAPPFYGGHGHSVLARILSEPHPPVRKTFPACAAELDQILDRALAKNPRDRFPTCGEFGAALAGFAAKLPGLATDLQERMASRISTVKAGSRALHALLPNFPQEDRPFLSPESPAPNDYGSLLERHAEVDRYLRGSDDALATGLPLLRNLKTAYELFVRGDFNACESEVTQLLTAAPDYAPARRLLDVCRRSRSTQSRRMQYNSRKLTLLTQARGALSRDEATLALTAANAILEFEPNQSEALTLQQEATEKLEQSDSERKQKIRDLLETCRARLRTGQYDAALKASEELLKLAPESGFALSDLAVEFRKDAGAEER
jgi:serine/threonine-protein kinase